MSVKRYVVGWGQGNGPFDKPEPTMIAGNWPPDMTSYVRSSDYDAACAERDAAKADLRAFGLDYEALLKRSDAYEIERDALAARVERLSRVVRSLPTRSNSFENYATLRNAVVATLSPQTEKESQL